MTGDGIHQKYPGDQPGGWTGLHVFTRYNAGHGYLLRSADSNSTKCLATNNGRDGWHIDTTGNTEYLGCRSEWSGRSGYRYTCQNNRTASGGVAFTGCRTDRSAGHGFLATGGLAIPLALTGCTFKRDAANNGSGHAGIRIRNFAEHPVGHCPQVPPVLLEPLRHPGTLGRPSAHRSRPLLAGCH